MSTQAEVQPLSCTPWAGLGSAPWAGVGCKAQEALLSCSISAALGTPGLALVFIPISPGCDFSCACSLTAAIRFIYFLSMEQVLVQAPDTETAEDYRGAPTLPRAIFGLCLTWGSARGAAAAGAAWVLLPFARMPRQKRQG